jgi:sigma-B regulation protein RsbU (phosphoserine phosphatase)
VTAEAGLLEETAEDLFENAPCGYLVTQLDGTITRVNRTFEAWTGLRRDQLLGGARLQDLLSVGGQIYYETHYAPLLRMQGAIRAIAVEIVRADGSRLPALVNSVVTKDEPRGAQVVRTAVFDATDRRQYEQELLTARRREQEIARQLQRSMLSGRLPTAPELALDVAYRPGEEGLEVGGDWYDAFWLDNGLTLGLVVGDVVGRGIDAAATMGQLRSAVRALAATGLGPARLLDTLEAYARRHDVGRMATVVYAELDLAARRLRYACAGHPPPAILPPGGEPRFAWEGRSLPIDALTTPDEPRPEATLALAPGAALLLYTDGLIERRSSNIAEGLERLLRELSSRRDEPGLAQAVVRALEDREHPDDVCLLLARVI